jgi:putative acetyltransferase
LSVVTVRDETPDDRDAVADVVQRAFGDEGDTIVRLVEDLRASLDSEPGLSLVAVDGDEHVVGHVMFTRNVLDAPERLVDVQVLSPLAVLPGRQREGIGGELVRRGIESLARRGVPLVFLEGSPVYYSRFGFEPGSAHGFRRPSLRIPEPAFQVQLLPAYEPWMTGTLVYRHEFWDHDAVGLR